MHLISVTFSLKSPVTRLFVQRFVQANNKDIIKARMTGPLWGESAGEPHIDGLA